MAQPKFRIVLRSAAVVIACLFFALLATGLIREPRIPRLVLQCAMMVLFLVYGLFGLERADALLEFFFPTKGKSVIEVGLPASFRQQTANVPAQIGKAKVIAFTSIDHRHRPTGACRHLVAGSVAGPAAGLVICRYEAGPGFHLLCCDQDWNPITDTCHDTLEAAMHQAEFEYEGTAGTWRQVDQNAQRGA
jgi:hypothetical protein